MAGRTCSYPMCVEPEAVGCNRGLLLEECEHWAKAADPDSASSLDAGEGRIPAPAQTGEGGRDLRLPWTGNSLGLRDLPLVSASTRPIVLGVIGPFNAGKSTLLALFYLLLQRGESLAAGVFSGSLSLTGWENLASKLRWAPGAAPPQFPPHTSRAAGRQPGLLHLALRDATGVRRDFLVTDPPGEWFFLWAQNHAAQGAEGARWVERHADRYLFLVDRQALASAERGKARDGLRDLARRVAVGLRGRPIAVVWTKSDNLVKPAIEDALKECFALEMPGHATFEVRVRFGNEPRESVEEPCLSLMNWMFAPPPVSGRRLYLAPSDADDCFLSFRGLAVEP